MDYSELLHDFLDGELDSMHEDTLFGALQRDENLRLEMKDMLEMRRAVEADKAAFLPSATSTNAIFSQLGFAAPAAGGAALAGGAAAATSATGTTASAGAAGFGLAQMIGVFAGAALLTSLVFVGLVIPQARPDADATLGSRQSAEPAAVEFTMNVPAGFTFGTAAAAEQLNASAALASVTAAQANSAGKTAPANRNPHSQLQQSNFNSENIAGTALPYSNGQQDALASDAHNHTPSSPATELETISLSNALAASAASGTHLADAIQNGHYSDRNSFNDLESIPTAFAEMTAIETSSIPRFQFELRGNGDAKFFQEADVNSTGDPWFNEMSASMMLPIEDNFEFGVSFGQEVFSQVFYRNEIDGRRTEYEQKPRLFWGGITGRYYPLTANDAVIAPYAQMTLGFNFFGSVLKPAAGLRFTPDDSRMSLFVGAEYSHLLFWEEQQMFNSGKINLNYGVSYRL